MQFLKIVARHGHAVLDFVGADVLAAQYLRTRVRNCSCFVLLCFLILCGNGCAAVLVRRARFALLSFAVCSGPFGVATFECRKRCDLGVCRAEPRQF